MVNKNKRYDIFKLPEGSNDDIVIAHGDPHGMVTGLLVALKEKVANILCDPSVTGYTRGIIYVLRSPLIRKFTRIFIVDIAPPYGQEDVYFDIIERLESSEREIHMFKFYDHHRRSVYSEYFRDVDLVWSDTSYELTKMVAEEVRSILGCDEILIPVALTDEDRYFIRERYSVQDLWDHLDVAYGMFHISQVDCKEFMRLLYRLHKGHIGVQQAVAVFKRFAVNVPILSVAERQRYVEHRTPIMNYMWKHKMIERTLERRMDAIMLKYDVIRDTHIVFVKYNYLSQVIKGEEINMKKKLPRIYSAYREYDYYSFGSRLAFKSKNERIISMIMSDVRREVLRVFHDTIPVYDYVRGVVIDV